MDQPNFTEPDPGLRASDADVEWKWEFEAWISRRYVRHVALKAATAGPAPYVLVASFGVLFAFGWPRDLIAIVIVWLSTIVLAGAYVAIVGYGSAWVAHRFAFGTTVPVKRLARCLVWIANFTLWGWGLVGLFFTR